MSWNRLSFFANYLKRECVEQLLHQPLKSHETWKELDEVSLRNLGTVSDSEDVPAKLDWYPIITLYS